MEVKFGRHRRLCVALLAAAPAPSTSPRFGSHQGQYSWLLDARAAATKPVSSGDLFSAQQNITCRSEFDTASFLHLYQMVLPQKLVHVCNSVCMYACMYACMHACYA